MQIIQINICEKGRRLHRIKVNDLVLTNEIAVEFKQYLVKRFEKEILFVIKEK